MRYQEIITELFNTKGTWKIKAESNSYRVYEAVVGSLTYMVGFTEYKGDWGFTFKQKDWNSYRLSGDGNAAAVLSIMIEILNDFLQDKQPEKFSFSASLSEPSRVAVYRRMVSRLAHSIPYTCEEHTSGTQLEFKFTRQQDNIS